MRTSLTIFAWLAVASCGGTSLLLHPLVAGSPQVSIAMNDYSDGPNSCMTGGGRVVPDDGLRFLWISLEVKNVSAAHIKFDYSKCVVDDEGRFESPGYVTSWPTGFWPETSDLDPGEKSSRRLVYAYPKDKFPTMLDCSGVRFALEPRAH
jgi:hypothetical protein